MKERGAARGIAVVVTILAFGLLVVGGLFWFRQRQESLREDAAADASARSGMVVAALRGFPADAYAFGAVADLTTYGHNFAATSLGGMLKDPALREKTRAAVAALGDASAVEDLDAALASSAEVADLGLRSLAFAVFPLPATTAAASAGTTGPDADLPAIGGALVVACDDPAKVVAWLDAKLEAAERRDGPRGSAAPASTTAGELATAAGASPDASPSPATAAGESPAASPSPTTDPGAMVAAAPPPAVRGDIGGVAYVCREALCRAVRANTVILAAPLTGLRRILETPPGAASPADTPRVRQAIEATSASIDAVFAFVDLGRLVELSRSSLAADAPGRRAFDALGIGALDGLAFSQHPEGALFHDRVRVTYAPDRGGLLGALLDVPPAEITLDRVLPGTAAVVSAGRLPDLPVLFDRILAEVRKTLAPAEAAQLDVALAGLHGQLGIDLRNDVLAALGGEWGLAYTPGQSSTAPAAGGMEGAALSALSGTRFTLVLGVQSKEKVRALLARLDAIATAQGMPVKVEPVGQGGELRSLPLPLPGGSPSLAFLDDRIVIGLPAEDVRAAVEGGSSALGSDPAYAELRARLPKLASALAYTRSTGATFREFLTVLARTGDAEAEARRQTRASIDAISQAVAAYRSARNGQLPRVASIEELSAALEPTYASSLPLSDAWGRPLRYAHIPARDGYASAFVLWSAGPDGIEEVNWAACGAACPEAASLPDSPGEDVVLSGGVFVRGEAKPAAVPGAPLPPALEDLAVEVDRRLGAMSPSLALVRAEPASGAGGLAAVTYESLAAIETSTIPGVLGALAIPAWMGTARGGAWPAGGAEGAGRAPEGANGATRDPFSPAHPGNDGVTGEDAPSDAPGVTGAGEATPAATPEGPSR